MHAVAELTKVRRCYGSTVAVDGLDLVIPRGGIYALLGPNGAGKTTAIALLLGLTRPQRGQVRVFGEAAGALAVRRRIGAMLQVGGAPGALTVSELIEQFRGYYPSPCALADVIELAGLEGLERRRFEALSGGQQQRVLFALAICGRPELLVLDEPTVGLDVGIRRQLWQVIRGLSAAGTTVLLTTHYLEEADALADTVGVLRQGRLLAEGTPAAIKAHVGGRVVRCRTQLGADVLAGLPGLRGLRRAGSRVELHVDRAEPLLIELLARDPELGDLEVAPLALEDAFLQLTSPAGSTTDPTTAVAA